MIEARSDGRAVDVSASVDGGMPVESDAVGEACGVELGAGAELSPGDPPAQPLTAAIRMTTATPCMSLMTL